MGGRQEARGALAQVTLAIQGHVMSFDALSCLLKLCHILACSIMSCHVMSCLLIPHFLWQLKIVLRGHSCPTQLLHPRCLGVGPCRAPVRLNTSSIPPSQPRHPSLLYCSYDIGYVGIIIRVQLASASATRVVAVETLY